MDMKDFKPELTTPGILAADNTALPLEPELADLSPVEAGTPTPVVGGQGEPKGEPQKSPTPWQDSLRRLRRDVRAMVSLGVILFFVLLALIGPLIYQHIGGPFNSPLNGMIGPAQYHSFAYEELSMQDTTPSAMYWLGTDDLGRDILARIMQGLSVSISVAVIVEIIDIVLGVGIGVLAGFYGGWIDQLLARFTDIMFAFPGLLFAILVVGILGNWADTALANVPIVGANGNDRLVLVSLALAITVWPQMARYVRGQALQLKEQQFVEAARTAGSTSTTIILKHLIPNLFSIVVVVATLDISTTIIAEAGLSYLGLGVKPPGSSIGLMISDASQYLDSHPWEVLVPCLVLTIIVLAFSFFGDGLRDAFDPRSKD